MVELRNRRSPLLWRSALHWSIAVMAWQIERTGPQVEQADLKSMQIKSPDRVSDASPFFAALDPL